MKVAFYTLGCKLNQSETYSMANLIQNNGDEIVEIDANPDVCIINTCTVTSRSDQRCRQMIRHIIQKNPNSSIIVTGCYAQRNSLNIKSIPGVNLVIGNPEKAHIIDYLNKLKINNLNREVNVSTIKNEIFQSIFGNIGKTRAFIKIQDGCDSNCSYCIVPQVRGKNRSIPQSDIIEQIKIAVSLGYPEIVLTGIHIGTYGKDNPLFPDLTSVLKEALKFIYPARIRLSSIEPDEITDELLEIISLNKQICKHIHIPLQSGSDEILKIMNRGYTRNRFASILQKIVNNYYDIAIGIDLIVGFPGETEKNFEKTIELINNLPITYIHVFPYSSRPGTKASKLKETVSAFEKKNRVSIIREISKNKNLIYKNRFIGRFLPAIIETTRNKKTGKLIGLTDNYLKVLIDGHDSLMKKICDVEILGTYEDFLDAKIIDKT